LNILIVTAMFPPIRTGTSFYALNLSNALKAGGHTVGIVTVETPEDGSPNALRRDELVIAKLDAFKVPMKNFFNHLRFTSLFPSSYSRLYKACKEFKPDVIFVVNHYLDIVFPAIFASKLLGIPLVCSVGTQLQSANPRRDRVLNILDRIICGWFVFPFCQKIIAWDREIFRYLSDIQGERVTKKTAIVNFGVNGNEDLLFSHEHDYEACTQILGVGAVTEQRNFFPLIEAFSKLSQTFPLLRLKIIGHVYYQGTIDLIESLGLSGRIDLVGEQAHEFVLQQMRQSAVYFMSLSGRYLGLGTATLEAMLLGLPVVANVPFDLLGTADLIDGENIMLSDGLDPLKIAGVMESLLLDPEMRRRVGTGSKKFARQNLYWQKVANDMSEVLGQVVLDAAPKGQK
jgi:glycosyltransferase involved in cell wall biosynthesis